MVARTFAPCSEATIAFSSNCDVSSDSGEAAAAAEAGAEEAAGACFRGGSGGAGPAGTAACGSSSRLNSFHRWEIRANSSKSCKCRMRNTSWRSFSSTSSLSAVKTASAIDIMNGPAVNANFSAGAKNHWPTRNGRNTNRIANSTTILSGGGSTILRAESEVEKRRGFRLELRKDSDKQRAEQTAVIVVLCKQIEQGHV